VTETTVDLTVSLELLAAIGETRLAEHLALLGPSSIRRVPFEEQPRDYGVAMPEINAVYRLTMPDAPEGAKQITPWFGVHRDGDTSTPYLGGIDWYDARGQLIHTTQCATPAGRGVAEGDERD
jgi:hypothetical protein